VRALSSASLRNKLFILSYTVLLTSGTYLEEYLVNPLATLDTALPASLNTGLSKAPSTYRLPNGSEFETYPAPGLYPYIGLYGSPLGSKLVIGLSLVFCGGSSSTIPPSAYFFQSQYFS
jgi:hypothetical protein